MTFIFLCFTQPPLLHNFVHCFFLPFSPSFTYSSIISFLFLSVYIDLLKIIIEDGHHIVQDDARGELHCFFITLNVRMLFSNNGNNHYNYYSYHNIHQNHKHRWPQHKRKPWRVLLHSLSCKSFREWQHIKDAVIMQRQNKREVI